MEPKDQSNSSLQIINNSHYGLFPDANNDFASYSFGLLYPVIQREADQFGSFRSNLAGMSSFNERYLIVYAPSPLSLNLMFEKKVTSDFIKKILPDGSLNIFDLYFSVFFSSSIGLYKWLGEEYSSLYRSALSTIDYEYHDVIFSYLNDIFGTHDPDLIPSVIKSKSMIDFSDEIEPFDIVRDLLTRAAHTFGNAINKIYLDHMKRQMISNFTVAETSLDYNWDQIYKIFNKK